MANTTRSPTLTSATPSLTGSSSRPNSVVSAPHGTVANAANAAVTDRIGASVKSHLSAPFGRSSSFIRSLRMSASGCNSPCGPTRYGPYRCCMKPMIFRSASTSSADALISMKNVRPMMASWTPDLRSNSVRSCQHRLFRAPVGRQRASSFLHVRLELVPEVVQRGEHRGRRRITERTQRFADDVGGHAKEQVDVLHLPVAALDPQQQLVEP